MTKQQHAKKMYWDLIRKAIARENGPGKLTKKDFVEYHHAIPKYLLKDKGPVPYNEVALRPREHVLAHKLLVRAGIETVPTFKNSKNTVYLAAIRTMNKKGGWSTIFGKEQKAVDNIMGILGSMGFEKEKGKKIVKKLLEEGILHVDKKRL